MGSSSVRFVVSTSQPGLGWTDTNTSGASFGSWTSILVVEASSRSLGTLRVTMENPPLVPGSGIVTCADAGPANTTTRAVAKTAAKTRRMVRKVTPGTGPGRFRGVHTSARAGDRFPG